MEKHEKNIITYVRLATFFFLMVALAGCYTQKQVVQQSSIPSCALPSGYDLSSAFSQARATLQNPACRSEFDAVFNKLLEIAKGDPKAENKRLFHDFLLWCKGNGVISMVMAKEKFHRYFLRDFYSLPDSYQVAAYCKTIDRLQRDMRDELNQKHIGLVDVCKDMELYSKTVEDFQSLQLILAVTCSALEDTQ